MNFKSSITLDRDLLASDELLAYCTLPADWKAIYYKEVEEGFSKDFLRQIKKDTKIVHLEGVPFYFGQAEMWDASDIIANSRDYFDFSADEEWLINIVSIAEGRSHFFTNSDRLRVWLNRIIPGEATGQSYHAAQRLWLRKEVLGHLVINL